MLQKIILCAIVSLTALGSFAGWNVETNNDGTTVLANDAPDALEKKTVKLIPLINNGLWVSKTFDMSKLPAGWKSRTASAALRIYLQVADQSEAVRKIKRNGLTEQFEILVNGHSMVFNTSDPRFPQTRKWIDVPISLKSLNDTLTEVKMHKIDSPTNDDFIYLGVDTSASPASSKVSVDSGRNYRFESKVLGSDLKGEYMIRLVLFPGKQEITMDFEHDTDAADAVELQNGAKIRDGAILFDGRKSAALLKGSEGLNVTEKGLTVAGIVRMDPNTPASGKTDNNMLIAFKKGAWFLGRTGKQINLSFCSDGQNWNHALFGGEYPDLGEYFHVAAVFQFVNEHAQGNVGYLCSVYLNGELAVQKMFFYLKPTATSDPVIIGNGEVEGYAFNGAVADMKLFSRAMNAGEVALLAKNSKRIRKMPSGFFEVAPELTRALDAAGKSARNPETKWIAESLKRAAETGYDQKRMLSLLTKSSALLASGKKGEELLEAWNQNCAEIQIVPSSCGMLMVACRENGGNSPVLGWYHSATRRDILAGRGTGWTITLDGQPIHDYSSGVTYVTSPIRKEADGGCFDVTWKKEGIFECISRFTFSGCRLEQTLEVRNLRKNGILSHVTFPRFSVRQLPGGNDRLAWPRFSGTLARNPADAYNDAALYPTGNCTMQFCGYFDQQQNGVYLAFEAVDCAAKTQSVTGHNGVLEYKWMNPVAVPGGGNGFRSSGPAVLEAYQGDWFEAGQIYKKFVENRAPWNVKKLPRQDTPAWYHNNTFWLCSSPGYVDSCLYLREYLEMPYAVWLCAWEDREKSDQEKMVILPADSAKRAVKELIPQGVFLQSYINSRLWGYIQRVKYVDLTKSDPVLKYGVRQQNGKSQDEMYDTMFSVMCPGANFWRENLLRLAGDASRCGFNGIYWDQLPCGSPRICWNPEHGHAPGDPTAWVRGYRAMLKELRTRYPHLALDGEDNSEVYNDVVDGYMTWRSTAPNHIPMFQSIYGGGRVQFTARGFDVFGGKSGSYQASFAKLGEQFVCGEQLGWFHIYDIRHGDPRRLYAKKLAHLRKALLGYFQAADMLHPPRFQEPMPQLQCLWGNSKAVQSSDKIAGGAWKRLRDGRILLVFTNTVDETLTVQPVSRYPEMDKLAVCAEGEAVRYIDLAQSGNPSVTLAPYTSCVWLLGREYDKTEAEAIGKTMKQIAGYHSYGESICEQAPKFQKTGKLQAEGGKWITPQDSSWLLFAYKEDQPTVEFQPSGPPEYRSNWIRAVKGSVISYGEVDFGASAPASLEIELAVSAENAGGKVLLYDVTGDRRPNALLAEIKTEHTGGWLTWKRFRVPLKKSVTGKRLIVIRVDDSDCNIRSWRVVKQKEK